MIIDFQQHCTGSAKVVGSNPFQSLRIFSGLFLSVVLWLFSHLSSNKFICAHFLIFVSPRYQVLATYSCPQKRLSLLTGGTFVRGKDEPPFWPRAKASQAKNDRRALGTTVRFLLAHLSQVF